MSREGTGVWKGQRYVGDTGIERDKGIEGTWVWKGIRVWR